MLIFSVVVLNDYSPLQTISRNFAPKRYDDYDDCTEREIVTADEQGMKRR